MLNHCYFEGRKIDFGYSSPHKRKNKFTVVVGKNGTGKSRLLSALVKDLINKHYSIDFGRNRAPYDAGEIETSYGFMPHKIIAVSTNPFDKFPLEGRQVGSELYNYLGLRGLVSTNLGLTFMARILGNLLSSILRNPQRAWVIKSALTDLGYLPYIKARLLLQIRQEDLEEFESAVDPVDFILSRNFRMDKFGGKYQYSYASGRRRPYDQDDIEKAAELANSIRHVISDQFPSRLDLLLDQNGIHEERYNFQLGPEHIALLNAGLLRLKDIELQKAGTNRPYRISDASSGEQCVLMSLLGIASQIDNNSLICIDEPEVCLHPEWQEQYIDRLISTFEEFSNCHFVIATHSPQIVANLRAENCYVVDIEKSVTLEASAFNHRSIDFQLANVFRAPGFRNEYLSRELLSTLTRISTEAPVSQKTLKKAKELLHFAEMLHDDDPLVDLMRILSKAVLEADA